MQVEKNWTLNNNVEAENIALFRFNNVSGEWEELSATYTESDDTYYYYTSEVNSFSYFAISEKSVVGDGEEGTTDTAAGKFQWWWIVAAVVVIALIWWFTSRKKKF